MTASAGPGVCRYCLCSEESPCRTPPCGEPCNWIDRERTVCSNYRCVVRYRIDQKIEAARKLALSFRRDDKAGRVMRSGRRRKKGGKRYE